jgi:hypothetical protein
MLPVIRKTICHPLEICVTFVRHAGGDLNTWHLYWTNPLASELHSFFSFSRTPKNFALSDIRYFLIILFLEVQVEVIIT